MLRDIAVSIYEAREARRARRKAKKAAARKQRRDAARTGAEEQRALERSAMLNQQDERNSMAREDARSMALEVQHRTSKILQEARQSELRERAYNAQEEEKQLALLREDGLLFRFHRTATMYKWRDSTELFETFTVGSIVRQFIWLNEEDLKGVPVDLLAGDPPVMTGTEPIKRDVVLAACGDGAVRLIVYSLKSNRRSTGSIFVVGRAPDEVPVLSSCLLRTGSLHKKLGWIILYACGDGYIRCGWDHWKKLFKAQIGAPTPPESSDNTRTEKKLDDDWQAELPKLPPIEDTPPDHADIVYGLLNHGDWLFSWSADGTIKKWSLETGELLHTYKGTHGGVTSCVISSDGQYLLSAGDTSDPRIRLWDATYPATDKKASIEQQHEHQWYDHACDGCDLVRRVELAEDDLLRTAEFQASLYKKSNHKKQYKLKNEAGKEHNSTIDALENTRIYALEQAMEDTPDFAHCHGGAIRIFHEHQPHYLGRDGPPSHGDWINVVTLNEGNSLAASCGSDTFAKVWTFPEGRLLCRFKSKDWVTSCALGVVSDFQDSPIDVLVTCCADSTITIWDIEGQCAFQTLRGHEDSVVDLTFLHGGRFANDKAQNNPEQADVCNYLRTSSYDGTIRTWKLGSGLPFAPPPPLVEEAQPTEMTLRWEMPVQNGSSVVAFVIKQRENEIGEFDEVAKVELDLKENLTTFKRRMTALHPGSTYEYCVAAISKHGQGPWSLPSATRRCLAAVPGRIDAPIISGLTTTTMDITWLAPDSMGAHINKFIIRARGGVRARNFEDSEEIVLLWADAKANASRELAAAAARREKLETWLHENRHLGAKETLRVRRKLKEEENLTNQRRVLVEVALSANGSAASRKGITADQLLEMSARVTGLEPGMAYQFSIVAENKLGRGVWSAPSISAVTETCAPDPMVEAPWLQGSALTSLTIAWQAPRDNGCALTAFIIRYALTTIVDEMLDCEDKEESFADKAGLILRKDTAVAEATQKIDELMSHFNTKQVVEFKMAGKLSDQDFHVLRVALVLLMHVMDDDDHNTSACESTDSSPGDKSLEDLSSESPVSQEDRLKAEKRQNAQISMQKSLPQLSEVTSAMRHPEQFLGRVRSFRLATRDAELGQTLRPAFLPLPEHVVAMVEALGKDTSSLQLAISQHLVAWMKAIVDYDVNIYQKEIYPLLSQSTMAWRRRREILGSSLATNKVGGKVTHASIEGLESGESYRFQVCAVNDRGIGDFSPASRPFTVKRGPPGEPINVRASDPSISTLNVSWDPPLKTFGSAVFEYHIFIRSRQLGPFILVDTVNASRQQFVVKKLEPATVYEFAVLAENEIGKGLRSTPCPPIQTLPAQVPNAVDAPKVLGADFRAVRLHWNPPSFDGGYPVVRFHVNAFQNGESKGTCATLAQVAPTGPYFVNVLPGFLPATSEELSKDLLPREEFFMEDDVPYTFCVVAENAVGMSAASDHSSPVSIVRPA